MRESSVCNGGVFFQSNEWQRYYDEEVARMRNFLDDVSRDSGKSVSNHLKSNEPTISRASAERSKGVGDKQKKFLDDWISSIDNEKKDTKLQSRSKEDILLNKTSNSEVAYDKQKLMQKLMKIRGKLQIEHEEILRQQKRALIAEADLNLKEKVKELRANIIAEKKARMEKRFMKILECHLDPSKTRELDSLKDENDEDRMIRIHATDCAKEVEGYAHEYFLRKVEHGLPYIRQAIVELHEEYRHRAKTRGRKDSFPIQSHESMMINDENIENTIRTSRTYGHSLKPSLSSSTSIASSSSSRSRNVLQEEIKRVMIEQKQQFRDEFYDPDFLSGLSPENIPKVQQLEKLVDENLKMAAQIMVLRELKFFS